MLAGYLHAACKNSLDDVLQYSERQAKSRNPTQCFLHVEKSGWGASGFLRLLGCWFSSQWGLFACGFFQSFFYYVQTVLETETAATSPISEQSKSNPTVRLFYLVAKQRS